MNTNDILKEALDDLNKNVSCEITMQEWAIKYADTPDSVVVKALTLLDKVEQGGDLLNDSHKVNIPSKNVTSSREAALRGYNLAIDNISNNYILIERESDD